MPHSASHARCAVLMEGAVMQRVCNIADCIMQSIAHNLLLSCGQSSPFTGATDARFLQLPQGLYKITSRCPDAQS